MGKLCGESVWGLCSGWFFVGAVSDRDSVAYLSRSDAAPTLCAGYHAPAR